MPQVLIIHDRVNQVPVKVVDQIPYDPKTGKIMPLGGWRRIRAEHEDMNEHEDDYRRACG